MTIDEKITAMRTNRFTRGEYLLLLSLMLLAFIPSIDQLVVDRLVVGSGDEVLNIAGQIEWFDLFNETLLAFLIVPMYFVLNRSRDDDDLSNRINTTFLIGFVAYAAVSLAIYLYAGTLTAYMDAPEESIRYLRLETIGFVIGFVFSYIYVVLVVRAKWRLFMALIVAKTMALIVGNSVLIPDNGATGIAMTNVSVNLIMSAIAVVLLHREGLLRRWSGFDMEAVRDWTRTGLFSGGQVFVANLVYISVVMRMVSDVSQVGDYWLANNFIWGWLIVPVAALGDMLKQEYYDGYRRIGNYLGLTIAILVVWLVSVPLWGFYCSDLVGMDDPSAVLDIVYKIVPFYVAYAFSTIIQSLLVSVGRTDYIFYEILFVNIVYYGSVYALFVNGVFTASMDFIIAMFGTGLVICLMIDLVLYRYSKRSIPPQYRVRA